MAFLDTINVTFSAVQDTNTTAKLISENFSVSNEPHTGMNEGYFELASGASGAFTFNGMSLGAVLYLASDQPVTLTVNGSNHTFTATHLMLDGGNVSSLVLSNGNAVTAHLRLVLIGS